MTIRAVCITNQVAHATVLAPFRASQKNFPPFADLGYWLHRQRM
jgi:hypothetical protein